MTCFACGGTALAVVLLPGDDEPQATICLSCGEVQPVEEEAERT